MSDGAVLPTMEEMKAADAAPEQVEQESAVETQQVEQTAEPEKKEEKGEPQFVPLAVHMRQREKLERELSALRQQTEVGNQRLQELYSKLNPAPEAPSETDDTLGFLTHQTKQVASKLDAIEQDRQAERQRHEQERYVAQVTDWVKRDEAAFAKQHEDYEDVVAHAKAVKIAEYRAVGLSEEQAQAKMRADVMAIAMHAAQQGYSAAEMAYNLGKALGYRQVPKQEKPEGTNVVKMRQEGQKMQVGGGAGGKSGTPSFADLAAMSDEEFKAAVKGGNWKKIAGG